MNNNATVSEYMEYGELLIALASAIDLGWDVILFKDTAERFVCQIEGYEHDKQFVYKTTTVKGAVLGALLKFQSEVGEL